MRLPFAKPRKSRKKRPAFSSIVDRRTPQQKIVAAKKLRGTTPVKRKNAKRRVSEFARCYGSRERVSWINEHPCLLSGAFFFDASGGKYRGCCAGKTENAHIKGGGGSRKADAQFIVPLCQSHHTTSDSSLHYLQPLLFERMWRVNLADEAAKIKENSILMADLKRWLSNKRAEIEADAKRVGL